MEKLIFTIPKSRSEEIRVGLSEFTKDDTTYDMFYARVFYGSSDGYRPARNGLNLKLVHLPVLIKALQATETAARVAGLLADGPNQEKGSAEAA